MASIKADRIIDQWMTVIENGAGQGEQIYTNLTDQLQKAHLPGVSWRKEQGTSGLMGKGFGNFWWYDTVIFGNTRCLSLPEISAHILIAGGSDGPAQGVEAGT